MTRSLSRLDAAPTALSFVDEDGQSIALAHGDISRLVRHADHLEIYTANGELLVVELATFDSAGSLGHEASGDARSDFERIVQVVHYYAGGLELECAPSVDPAAQSSGDLVVEETCDGSTRDDAWMTEMTLESDSLEDDPFTPRPVTFGDDDA